MGDGAALFYLNFVYPNLSLYIFSILKKCIDVFHGFKNLPNIY